MSNFMARTAKKLVREKGILSTPNPKLSHSITETKVDLVIRVSMKAMNPAA